MLHNCVGQEKDGWQEVKSRKKKRVNLSPVKPCKFDEKCNKGRFCSFTHTKWSKMTKSTTDNNVSEDLSHSSSTDMSKPFEQNISTYACDVMEQLFKLYPGDLNLSEALTPVYIKEEIGDASLNNLTMVDLEKVSTIISELLEKEITNTLEQVSITWMDTMKVSLIVADIYDSGNFVSI